MLKAGDYSEVSAMLPTLKEAAYCSAVDFYHQGKYANAKKGFKLFGDYMDASSYLVLLEAHAKRVFIDTSYAIDKLFPLIGFEDAGELIMYGHKTAVEFLKGKFSGSGYYLKIWYDDEWWGQWDLPDTRSGQWSIYKGLFYVSDKAVLNIEIVDYYTVRITSLKTGRSYLLYRQ